MKKDLSHLAGRRVIMTTIDDDTDTEHFQVAEVALLEFDMGATIKAITVPDEYDPLFEGFGDICLNGASSPNTGHFEAFAEAYEEAFDYLVDCIENYKVIRQNDLVRILGPNDTINGLIECATGMPV